MSVADPKNLYMPNVLQDDFSKLEYEGWSRVSDLYDQSWANLTKQFIEPLLNAVNIQPGMKVLDVACGPGYVSQAIYSRGATATGVDFSASMIALAPAAENGGLTQESIHGNESPWSA